MKLALIAIAAVTFIALGAGQRSAPTSQFHTVAFVPAPPPRIEQTPAVIQVQAPASSPAPARTSNSITPARQALTIQAAKTFAMAEYATENCDATPLPIKTQNGLMELIIEGGAEARQAFQTEARIYQTFEAKNGRRAVCAAFAELDRIGRKQRR